MTQRLTHLQQHAGATAAPAPPSSTAKAKKQPRPADNAKLIKISDKISIPCELMKYNWNVNKNSNFCLNPKKCISDKIDPKDLCFSFNKGRRCTIYIKKDIKKDILDKSVKKCPEGKVLNPLTNKCIKIKTINKVRKNPLSKPEKPDKKCPEGKVINPKSGRCINIKPVKPDKKCPEGKVINPKSGRCINIKPVKPDKKCPEGKAINPKTGKCIKLK
jgi:hypothetical protein